MIFASLSPMHPISPRILVQAEGTEPRVKQRNSPNQLHCRRPAHDPCCHWSDVAKPIVVHTFVRLTCQPSRPSALWMMPPQVRCMLKILSKWTRTAPIASHYRLRLRDWGGGFGGELGIPSGPFEAIKGRHVRFPLHCHCLNGFTDIWSAWA